MLRFKVNQLRSSLRKSNYNVHTKYKTIIQKNQYTTTYYSNLNKKCKQYYYFQNLIKNNNLLSSSSTIRIIANNNRKNFTTKTSNKTNNSDSDAKSKNSENIKTNIVNTKQDVNYGNKDEIPKFVESFTFHDQEFKVEVSDMGTFADAASIATYGSTSVLNTVVYENPNIGQAMEDPNFDPTFMPLTVEYREKEFAGGKIPTSFNRKEAGIKEHEILIGRKLDRALRPMFPKGICSEIQLISTLYSYDRKNLPDVVGLNGLSIALNLSSLPFSGPIAAIRIGLTPDFKDFIFMPSQAEVAKSPMDLVYVGNKNNCIMLDVEGNQVRDSTVGEAFLVAHKAIQPMIEFQESLISKYGKTKNVSILDGNVPSNDIMDEALQLGYEKAKEIWSDKKVEMKSSRSKEQGMFTNWLVNKMEDKYNNNNKLEKQNNNNLPSASSSWTRSMLQVAAHSVQEKAVRDLILEKNHRVDGRKLTELRKVNGKRQVVPVVHGSSFFSRGETQALCTVTLGGLNDRQQMSNDIVNGTYDKDFFLHYDFPPYSVNETGRLGGVNRRMIGHGALAEKALAPVMPDNKVLSIENAIKLCDEDNNAKEAELRRIQEKNDMKIAEENEKLRIRQIWEEKKAQAVKDETLRRQALIREIEEKRGSIVDKVKSVFGFGDKSEEKIKEINKVPINSTEELAKIRKEYDEQLKAWRLSKKTAWNQFFKKHHAALANGGQSQAKFGEYHFPYTTRVTSEVTASDGSSSMATVTGATLALIDAGVKLKKPVVGVSIGLVTPYETMEDQDWSNDKIPHKIITDILGFEDHFTDMDFKTAGTSTGVTAIQLDMKRQGIPPSILQNALKVGTNTRKKMSTILNRQGAFSPPHKMKNGVKQRAFVDIHDTLEADFSLSRMKTLRDMEAYVKNKIIEDLGLMEYETLVEEEVRKDLDRQDKICNVSISRDSGIIEVAAVNHEVLMEGLKVVTNYCKPLTIGEQLTGKIVHMGATGARVQIDGGVKELWLPFNEISGVPLDSIAAERFIQYDTPVIVEIIPSDDPNREEMVNDTVKLIGANGKKVYKYDNNSVAQISHNYIKRGKEIEMAQKNLLTGAGGYGGRNVNILNAARSMINNDISGGGGSSSSSSSSSSSDNEYVRQIGSENDDANTSKSSNKKSLNNSLIGDFGYGEPVKTTNSIMSTDFNSVVSTTSTSQKSAKYKKKTLKKSNRLKKGKKERDADPFDSYTAIVNKNMKELNKFHGEKFPGYSSTWVLEKKNRRKRKARIKVPPKKIMKKKNNNNNNTTAKNNNEANSNGDDKFTPSFVKKVVN